MIAVIADDFSGAAEIAGIGFRYGLKCEVVTECISGHHPDLLVIDANTRSSTESEAIEKMKKIVRNLPEVTWIYKKTDSVFRGHIAVELETLLEFLAVPSALLIPANPSLGRRIIDGIYTVDNVPLQETAFSGDPEGRNASSKVIDLLNASCSACVLDCDTFEKDKIPHIVVGNAGQPDHLKQWALKVQDGILPAGGADFFSAILESKGCHVDQSRRDDHFSRPERILIFQGAGHQLANGIEKEMAIQKGNFNLLEYRFNDIEQLNEQTYQKWVSQLASSLRENRVTLIRFQTDYPRTLTLNQTLAACTGDILRGALSSKFMPHLIIEGGSTASAIVRCMGWKRWIPIEEPGRGTVTLNEKVSGMTLTVKPGSYAWPDHIKKLIYSPSIRKETENA